MLRAILFAAITCLFGPSLACAATPIDGVFALENVAPGVDGELLAAPQGTPFNLRLDIMFHRVSEKNAMKKYETISDRQMRVMVVSEDLNTVIERQIEHVIDGHGQAWVRFPRAGLYHVYADATPKTLPLQVVRFDLHVGDDAPSTPPSLGGAAAEAHVGPYIVRFDSLTLRGGTPHTLHMHISEMGKPAKNLLADQDHGPEATMISATDLHLVPLSLIKSESGGSNDTATFSDPSFRMGATPPGTYRLFVSFSGGRTMYIASFVALIE